MATRMDRKEKRYRGPGGGYFSARAVSQGAANVRAAGGDKAFAGWADKELAALKQGRTTQGPPAKPGSYKKGGKVKKTGIAKVHKGERVLTKKQTKKYESSRKKHFGI